MLRVCVADDAAHVGRVPYRCADLLLLAIDSALSVKFSDLTGDLSNPEAIKNGFRQKRVESVRLAIRFLKP
jgi:hypothetical protein